MRLRLLAMRASFRFAIFQLAMSCTIGVAQVSLVHSAEFISAVSKEGKTIVLLDGEIEPGDSVKLALIVTALDNQKRAVSALYLNSPGGTGRDDFAMAALVKRFKISTIVADGAECASACFTVFAAGHKKFAGYRAQIGVHRASSEKGEETDAAFAATVEVARHLSELGVPPAIVGKLVLTPPDQMAWLSPDDLRSMSVTIASGLRWPGTAVASGDKAPVKPDGLNDLGPQCLFHRRQGRPRCHGDDVRRQACQNHPVEGLQDRFGSLFVLGHARRLVEECRRQKGAEGAATLRRSAAYRRACGLCRAGKAA
jgi:hypothetical protein